MSNFLSRAELEEISHGLIEVYAKQNPKKTVQSIDIGHFITGFLMLKIEYVSFAEDDCSKVGFMADGETPILLHFPEEYYCTRQISSCRKRVWQTAVYDGA